MNEIELNKAALKGIQAQHLLDDELLSECFETLKQEYYDYWKITHVNDVNGRERLWQAHNIVDKVKEHLARIAAGGRLATKHLSSIKTLKS